MTPNEKAAREFAAQFTPPLDVVKSERINNVPMPDAWVCAYWDNARSVGVTVAAYGGGIHAYLEAAGPSGIAASAGKVVARALGLFQENSDGDETHADPA